MIIDFFNRGGGGGGTAQYATSAGTADNSKLLDGIQSFPQSANTGDVVAINGEPLRGMRSPVPSIEAGVYQYDGSNWNKIDAKGSYVVDLSTNNPDDFIQQDIEHLNIFYEDVMEDPAIVYNSCILVESEIYKIVYGNVDVENGNLDCIFVYDEGGFANEINLNFDGNGYSGGILITTIVNDCIYPNDIPEEPENGTVYAAPYYIPTETLTLLYDDIVTDINDGDYSYFECWFDNHSNHFYVAGNGHFEWQGIKLTGTTDTNIVLIDDNGDPIQGLTDGMVIGSIVNGEVFVQYNDNEGIITIVVNRADWDGSADIPEGKDQAYVDEMCGGEDTEKEDGYAVYQGAVRTEDEAIVEVTYPNGTFDGSATWQSTDMRIDIHEWPAESAIVSNIEYYGSRYRFMVDDANNEVITVYDDNDDKLIVIRDGESDTFVCEDGLGNDVDINCSLNGGIFYAKTSDDSSINWENTENITKEVDAPYLKPLAFKEELPEKLELLPQGWNAAELLMSNGGGIKPIWYSRELVLQDTLRDTYQYDENDGLMFLGRDGYWDIGWKKFDNSTLNPKDNLPVQAEEGAAFSNSSDGIVQAQGTTADTSNLYEIEMKNAWRADLVGVKGLVVSSITTADRFVFQFDGNDDTHFYWNGSGWDTENFEVDTDNGNGEISGHTTLSSTAVTIEISYDSNDGCYYFAFGRGWVQYYIGNDNNDFSTSTVWVRDLPVTQYKNAVMSSTIKEIVKCTQADYDAMVSGGTVDNNTFYVIIANPV